MSDTAAAPESAADLTPTPTPQKAPDASPAPGGRATDAPAEEPQTASEAMPSVFDQLRRDYARAGATRSKVLPIVPGRYHGLGARYTPIDWDRRDEVEAEAFRRGLRGTSLVMAQQAGVIVLATDSIVMRDEEGKWRNLHTFNSAWKAGPSVGWDERLCAALDIATGSYTPGPEEICQMVFQNAGALEAHFQMLDLWLKEEIAAGGEDEDDPERPM